MSQEYSSRSMLFHFGLYTHIELVCLDVKVIFLSTSHLRIWIAMSSASNAGCRTALSRLCVLLTGSYGDPIWLQAVLYASGGYVSRRDSFASRTRVYTRACLYLSITSFEKVAWGNARIETLLLNMKSIIAGDIGNFYSAQSPLSCSYLPGNVSIA